MKHMALRGTVLVFLGLSLPALAQVHLQFGYPSSSGSFNATYTYARGVQLTNNDALLAGWASYTAIRPGLSTVPGQRAQIALAAIGPTPFQNAPADLLPVLGGSSIDEPQAAAVDPSGNIWIVGNTDSDDFHVVNPIVQIAPNAVPPFTLCNLSTGVSSNAVQLY